MGLLSISTLNKSFGSRKILDDFNLDCCKGEIIGIFGRNGCGKSTLLKILFGTVKADSIAMHINDTKIIPREVIASKKIAYLPQDPFLPKGVKVRDIIPMFYKGDDQDRIFYAPGIHRISGNLVGNLSMGELRYLELLLLAYLDHPYLMLDEPFSMVEPLYKEQISALLHQLKSSKGILVTDHYYKDVLSISSRNIVLKDGKANPVLNEDSLRAEGYLPAHIIV